MSQAWDQLKGDLVMDSVSRLQKHAGESRSEAQRALESRVTAGVVEDYGKRDMDALSSSAWLANYTVGSRVIREWRHKHPGPEPAAEGEV